MRQEAAAALVGCWSFCIASYTLCTLLNPLSQTSPSSTLPWSLLVYLAHHLFLPACPVQPHPPCCEHIIHSCCKLDIRRISRTSTAVRAGPAVMPWDISCTAKHSTPSGSPCCGETAAAHHTPNVAVAANVINVAKLEHPCPNRVTAWALPSEIHLALCDLDN